MNIMLNMCPVMSLRGLQMSGEMVKSVKHLPGKHKTLKLIPSSNIKSAHGCNCTTGEAETGGSWQSV